jgi:hypothetical protein
VQIFQSINPAGYQKGYQRAQYGHDSVLTKSTARIPSPLAGEARERGLLQIRQLRQSTATAHPLVELLTIRLSPQAGKSLVIPIPLVGEGVCQQPGMPNMGVNEVAGGNNMSMKCIFIDTFHRRVDHPKLIQLLMHEQNGFEPYR